MVRFLVPGLWINGWVSDSRFRRWIAGFLVPGLGDLMVGFLILGLGNEWLGFWFQD